ncbi:hypothetical protein ABES02_13355 [Neobacillus pocheonensis]|uniref:hypothetical protein n=1 Tax=Neobacillus pocheonensis TaxID=363869 RepID=UPI003D276696
MSTFYAVNRKKSPYIFVEVPSGLNLTLKKFFHLHKIVLKTNLSAKKCTLSAKLNNLSAKSSVLSAKTHHLSAKPVNRDQKKLTGPPTEQLDL